MKSYFLLQFLWQVLQSVLTQPSILKDCILTYIGFDKISEFGLFFVFFFFAVVLFSIFFLQNNTCQYPVFTGDFKDFPQIHAENSEELWRGWPYLLFCTSSSSPKTTSVPNIPFWWGEHHFPTTMQTLFLLLQDVWWLLTLKISTTPLCCDILPKFCTEAWSWAAHQQLSFAINYFWLFDCRSTLHFQRSGSLFKILSWKGSGGRVKRKHSTTFSHDQSEMLSIIAILFCTVVSLWQYSTPRCCTIP